MFAPRLWLVLDTKATGIAKDRLPLLAKRNTAGEDPSKFPELTMRSGLRLFWKSATVPKFEHRPGVVEIDVSGENVPPLTPSMNPTSSCVSSLNSKSGIPSPLRSLAPQSV